MISKLGKDQVAALAETKKVVDRLVEAGAWAPIGGDEVALAYAVGRLQDTGLVPAEDCRDRPSPKDYVRRGGPVAFTAPPPCPEPAHPPLTKGDRVRHSSWGGQTSTVSELAVATGPLPEPGRQYRGDRPPLWRDAQPGERPNIARCAVPGYLMSCWFPVRDLARVE